MTRRAVPACFAVVLFMFGAAAASQAGKKPCPGNSCHGQTTATAPATTTTEPTTTASPGGLIVPDSVPDDCTADAQPALAGWLATVPDGATVDFHAGCYRLDSTLELDGRTLTLDGQDATLRQTVAPDDQRPIIRAVGSALTVKDAILQGSYAQPGTLTDSLQHAHGIDARGTRLTVDTVTVRNVAGDCVYLGLGYDNTTRSAGIVSGLTCDGTGRNGVSVTAGDNVTVKQSSFDRVGYDGVDVEPNATAGNWGADGVTVTGNRFGSVHLTTLSVVETGPASNVAFTGNTSTTAMKVAVAAVGSVYSRPQNVTVIGNTGTSGTVSVEHVDGLIVSGNTGPVSISDCTRVTG